MLFLKVFPQWHSKGRSSVKKSRFHKIYLNLRVQRVPSDVVLSGKTYCSLWQCNETVAIRGKPAWTSKWLRCGVSNVLPCLSFDNILVHKDRIWSFWFSSEQGRYVISKSFSSMRFFRRCDIWTAFCIDFSCNQFLQDFSFWGFCNAVWASFSSFNFFSSMLLEVSEESFGFILNLNANKHSCFSWSLKTYNK